MIAPKTHPTYQQPELFPLEVLSQFQVLIRFASIDPAVNRARWYQLQWQPTLWGELALIQTWGRIGTTGGHRRVRVYADRTEAHDTLSQIIRHRLRHGYQITAWE